MSNVSGTSFREFTHIRVRTYLSHSLIIFSINVETANCAASNTDSLFLFPLPLILSLAKYVTIV